MIWGGVRELAEAEMAEGSCEEGSEGMEGWHYDVGGGDVLPLHFYGALAKV